MTPLEQYLIIVCLVLWLLGGLISYEAAVATGHCRPGKLEATTCVLFWPFIALYVYLIA